MNSNQKFRSKEYWDERYKNEPADSYDWFKTYDDLSAIIHQLAPKKDEEILMLGCGNSVLSEQNYHSELLLPSRMYDDGYKFITNLDYSGVVISQMLERHKALRPDMRWMEMDVRSLVFPCGSFDVAIDKGTLDAMLTPNDPWNPPQEMIDDCNKEMDEVFRILRPGGRFIYLTFGQPHFRKRYFTRHDWKLEVKELGESFHYYLYIATKPDP